MRWRDCFALLVPLALAPALVSADLVVVPEFSPYIFVDDNRRLRSVDPSGLLASVTQIGLDTYYTRETWSVTLEPEFRLTRNTSQKNLDAEDYFVNLSGEKRFERHVLAASFSFERELSATVELEEIGTIDAAVPRTLFGFEASWGYFVSDRFQVASFGAYNDVTYDADGDALLWDYSYAVGGINFDYVLSPQTVLLGRSSVSVFETPEFSSKVTSYNFQAGFRHAFTDTVDAEFLMGQNFAQTKLYTIQPTLVSLIPFQIADRRITVSDKAAGLIVSAEVVKKWVRSDLTVDWERQISPSSLGSRQDRQDVTGRLWHRFDDRLEMQLWTTYIEQEQETDDAALRNVQDRLSAGVLLRYRLGQYMTVSALYRRDLRFGTGGENDAYSNRVLLQFRYSGERFQFME